MACDLLKKSNVTMNNSYGEEGTVKLTTRYTVMLMNGNSFAIEIRDEDTVGDAMQAIHAVGGFTTDTQQLFAQHRPEPLNENSLMMDEMGQEREICLMIRKIPVFWKVYGKELSIDGGTGTLRRESGFDACLATASAVVETENVGYFEMEINTTRTWGMLVGALRPGVDCETFVDRNDAFLLSISSGKLHGRGKYGELQVDQSHIKKGDRVGILIDLRSSAGESGSVRFFVNGKEHGTGYRGLWDDANSKQCIGSMHCVKGPLVMGVQVTNSKGDIAALLPFAEPPAGVEL